MWNQGWRDQIWKTIDQQWDIIVVGGGITGAGIFREATRQGRKVLLVEQADFAWGTSSRSSKLVHGGLRYLKEGKIRLTRDSVREREQLLRDGPGLIEPLDFLLATYNGEHPGRLVYGAGLTIYDLLALRWSHRYYSAQDFQLMAGQLTPEGLAGGFRYGDAQTDDARLVLRVIREAAASGGTAINYTEAQQVIRDDAGKIVGLQLFDRVEDRTAEVRAAIIINATGAWANILRCAIADDEKIRPLRGSHLIFPAWRLPVAQAVSFLHPVDRRPVFILPWEKVTLVGTTDEDHGDSLDQESCITGQEVAYLMTAIDARYPSLGINTEDILSTFTGVRPVIGSSKVNPSEESRDHVIWNEEGMITVTGGKLTTFRLIAQEVMAEVIKVVGAPHHADSDASIFNATSLMADTADLLSQMQVRRLQGRYGSEAGEIVEAALPGELTEIPHTNILWAELRWAARSEGVVHLDDLLLRRVRLGLVSGKGGVPHMQRIRTICQPELGWPDERWQEEEDAYKLLWNRCYAPPPRCKVPDFRRPSSGMRDMAPETVRKEHASRTSMSMLSVSFMVLLVGTLLFLIWRQFRLDRDSAY